MTTITNLGLSRTVTLSKKKSLNEYTPELFKVPVIDITPEYVERYSDAKDRAEQKSATSERWTSNPLFKNDITSTLGYTINKDAIERIKEKLKEEGIDPSKRNPTHEITDEQMAQLAEKYDLEYLSMAGMEDPEYGNFLLDLGYMNVFSCNELENEFFGIGEPNGYLYCVETFDGSKAGYYIWNGKNFDTYEDMVKYTRMDYLRSKEPGRTESYYQAKYKDYMAKTQERLNILHDFFERASKFFYPGLADAPKPEIKDTSEKLKEDFGSRL